MPPASIDPLQTQSLKALLQTQNPLTQVVMEMVDGVMICDANAKLRLANPSLKRLLNLPTQCLGEPCKTLLPSEKIVSALLHVLDSGKALSEEFAVRAPGQQKQTFQIHMMPLFAENVAEAKLATTEIAITGPMTGAVAVFHDMTAIKKTERMRRDFVANVSHELRTPLSAIKGYAETLLDGALEDETVAHDFVNVIFNHAVRLSRLVEDLLDLSKLESPDFTLELDSVDLNAMILKVHSMVSGNIAGKELLFNLELAKELPPVWGNGGNLEQVLTNLLDNAVKYTPDGGEITVRTQRIVQTPELPEMVQVDVSDTGIGIDAKHFPRLFERFYRVDKARSRDLGGTGLGLSIVKHIVQTHGGDIWVNSIPNEGTTFSFTLPTRNN